MVKNKKYKNRKVLLAVVVLALLFTTGWYLYAKDRDNLVTDNDGIDYSPPTQTEIEETARNKENLANKDETSTSNSTSSSQVQVTPVISAWGQESPGSDLEVNGYVAGVIEKGGTCTLTLTRGSTKVTKSRESFDDAQNTSCGLITVERSKLSAGSWQAVLSYSSAKYNGTSNTVNIEVK